MNPARSFCAGIIAAAALFVAMLIVPITATAGYIILLALIVAAVYGLLFGDALLPAITRRSRVRRPAQPVAQPVVEPLELVVNNYRNQAPAAAPLPELVAVEDDNQPATSRQPAGNQPVTSQQPAYWQARDAVRADAGGSTRDYLADVAARSASSPLPPANGLPWDQMLATLATRNRLAEDPAVEDSDPLTLPLPRREPLAIQYPLIWRAVRDAETLNQAIYNLYGGKKDGLRHAWVRQVIAYYTDGPATDDDLTIFRWRLLAGSDHPGALADALGIDLDDDQLAELIADLARCTTCRRWQIAATIDPAGQCAGCRIHETA